MCEKFKEICPDKYLSHMFMVDVEEEVYSSFKKVGYTPSKTIKKALDKAWANSHREDALYEFVYRVWRYDS